MCKIKLYNGDCLEVMDKLIEEGVKVDLTVTSPPYDNLRTYNGNNDLWSENVWKCIIERLYKITVDGGVVVWVVNDATIKGSETGTSFKQALYFKEVGFNLHDTMIYQKSNFSNPSRNRYHQTFEYMFIMIKGKLKTFNPIFDRKNKYVNGSVGQNSVRGKDGNIKIVKNNKNKEWGMRHNVWLMNTAGQENMCKPIFHPAVFPEKLANDHIISWSNEGDTVFDPMMGSGTTGKMAILNNRNFIGIEIDKEYFKIAKERIENNE